MIYLLVAVLLLTAWRLTLAARRDGLLRVYGAHTAADTMPLVFQ